MKQQTKVVLTGGPGGGKTTLIHQLLHDPCWAGRFAALPEAIFLMKDIGISSTEKLFQRVMVQLQTNLEDGLVAGLGDSGSRIILCHRGSLDPLAYWLDRGWSEDSFFSYTGTTWQGHLQRYTAVIHLVTAADGAEAYYQRWPKAHRPETAADAVRLDSLLGQVWSRHPCYFRIDNTDKDWSQKAETAIQALQQVT